MTVRSRLLAAVAAVGALMLTPPVAHGDEGMWLFNAPPLTQLKAKYDFTPDAKWLEHVQKSSVRFNSGGSGSFVSKTGLVMTNHHVGADDLHPEADPSAAMPKTRARVNWRPAAPPVATSPR